MIGIGFVGLESKMKLTTDPQGRDDDIGDPVMVPNPCYKPLMPAKRAPWTEAEDELNKAMASNKIADVHETLKKAQIIAEEDATKKQISMGESTISDTIRGGVSLFKTLVECEVKSLAKTVKDFIENKSMLRNKAGSLIERSARDESDENKIYHRASEALEYCNTLEGIFEVKLSKGLLKETKHFVSDFEKQRKKNRKDSNAVEAGVFVEEAKESEVSEAKKKGRSRFSFVSPATAEAAAKAADVEPELEKTVLAMSETSHGR